MMVLPSLSASPVPPCTINNVLADFYRDSVAAATSWGPGDVSVLEKVFVSLRFRVMIHHR